MDSLESATRITADSLVQELIEDYPQAIPVFAHHGLQCVGCYIAAFHTITDTAREHDLPIEPLLGDLNRAIATVAA